MNKMETDLERLAGMISDIQFTMLTTVGDDGSIHSRPMATQKINPQKFDGTLWFFSKKNSHKIHCIENDQHVNLAYADPDHQRYVSICGRASISEDKSKMRELWEPGLKAWFPEGLEDPDLTLIGVSLENAEIWDSPPSKMVQMAGLVKSAVTGKPLNQNKSQSQHIEIPNRH